MPGVGSQNPMGLTPIEGVKESPSLLWRLQSWAHPIWQLLPPSLGLYLHPLSSHWVHLYLALSLIHVSSLDLGFP